MITKDNIDKYLEAAERRYVTHYELFIQAKNNFETLRDMVEDDKADIQDLRYLKESFKTNS